MHPDKKSVKTDRPVVAVSAGDPAGIGPEIVVDAVRSSDVLEAMTPLVFWPSCLPPPGPGVAFRLVGTTHDTPARAALACLEGALGEVESGRASALVTAPVSKERMAVEVQGFTGHTDWLASMARMEPSQVLMIFSGPRVVTACVTRHLPLSRVAATLRRSDVAWAALLLWGHLRHDLGLDRPRVAVCGLNPHASDGGLLGSEEKDIVGPAVRDARHALDLVGGEGEFTMPLAADAAFRGHVLGEYDAVLAMYHDQATVAAKMADPFVSVNVSAGLPWVRTSPDHGTADALRHTGMADPRSMKAALLMAGRIASMPRSLLSVMDALRAALESIDRARQAL